MSDPVIIANTTPGTFVSTFEQEAVRLLTAIESHLSVLRAKAVVDIAKADEETKGFFAHAYSEIKADVARIKAAL